MSIRARIIILFILIITFFLGSQIHDAAFTRSIMGDAKMINYSGSERMRTAKLAYLSRRYVARGLEEDRAEIEREMALYEKVLAGLRHGSADLDLVGAGDETSQRIIAEAEDIWKRYRGALEKLLAGGSADSLAEIDNLVFPLIGKMDELTFHLDGLSSSRVEDFNRIKIALVAVAALLGVIIVLDIILAMVRPMNRLLSGMERVADGNLDYRLAEGGGDEFSLLAASFDRMAERLKKSHTDLQKLNAELEDFVYTVSHDLKEPLRGISAFSQFVKEDYGDRLDETGKDYLDRIIESTGRMKRLIDDLLALSRIGRVKNELATVSSSDIIGEVMVTLRHRFEEKNAELRLQADLPEILCDEVKMREVFMNLLSNAVKYTGKDRPVVEVGCDDLGDEFRFYVKDNGIGIDERYHEKIFGLFERLNRREDYEGTGAGLAIVKKVIDEHEGKIWVESAPGMGSTFFFTLPKSRSSGGGNEREGSEYSDSGGQSKRRKDNREGLQSQ